MLQRLSKLSEEAHCGYGLILVPTAELAFQVQDVAREYAADITDIGRLTRGDSLSMKRDTGLLVATPGMLRNYLVDELFSGSRTVVLDEADLLLSASFRADMKVLQIFRMSVIACDCLASLYQYLQHFG